MIIELIIVIWIILSILTYGMHFAYFQRKYSIIAEEEYREDMAHAVLVAILSPISFWVIFFMTGFAKYGLKFK